MTTVYLHPAQLTMTAQFERQDALIAPNVAHTVLTWHNGAWNCRDCKQAKHHEHGLFGGRPHTVLTGMYTVNLQM